MATDTLMSAALWLLVLAFVVLCAVMIARPAEKRSAWLVGALWLCLVGIGVVVFADATNLPIPGVPE